MKKFFNVFLFLVLNFGALAIGAWLMNSGPSSNWYMDLAKAPWTPPGWVFGAAWTSIMLCFSFYMAILVGKRNTAVVWGLFFIQWILNVSWNFIFFNKHAIFLGELILILLTTIVAYLMHTYRKELRYLNILILPYFLWLLVANSLNIYTLLYN